MKRLIIDNGASSVKGILKGITPRQQQQQSDASAMEMEGSNSDNHEDLKLVHVPNWTGHLRSDQFKKIVGDDEIKSPSEFIATRSHERGYLVDPENQMVVWDRVMNRLGINSISESHVQEFIVTEPVFCPSKISRITDEIIFEQYGFQSCLKTNPQMLAYEHYCTLQQQGNAPGSAPYHPKSALVIDSGYSFTHIVPIIEGNWIPKCTKRIDIGGKLMTNYLKELITLRQMKMPEETILVNDIKEKTTFVSSDIGRDLKRCGERREERNPIWRDFVLPDYQTVMRGYVQTRVDPPKLDNHLQTVRMNSERFIVPESLFSPSIVGLNESGIPDTIQQALRLFPEELKTELLQNIVLIGGNCRIPGFARRLHNDLVPRCPVDSKIRIFQFDANNDIADDQTILPMDHEDFAMRGGAMLSSSAYSSRCVSRERYLEKGSM